MNFSLADLLQIIGDKEVTIIGLRTEIAALTKKLADKELDPKDES